MAEVLSKAEKFWMSPWLEKSTLFTALCTGGLVSKLEEPAVAEIV